MTTTPQTYAGEIDFDVSLLSEHEAVGQMAVASGILNPFGTVHAGAMIWFADVVATTLALQGTTPRPGMTGFPLAINLSANLVANCRDGKLRATARFVRAGRRVSVIRTTVETDEGKLLLDLTSSHVAS